MLIYLITNIRNGKQYIGQTMYDIPHRMSGHKHDAKTKNYPLYRAFRKYGLENFTISELEQCADINELNSHEQSWIKNLDTLTPNGYNLTTGGKSGGTISEITRQRMIDAHTGIKRPNISGTNHPRWGKHLSEETKEKIRRPQIGKFVSIETRQKMKAAWTEERRAAHHKPPSMATCHPDRTQFLKGLCSYCYYHIRHKLRYVPKAINSMTGVPKTELHKQHMKEAAAKRIPTTKYSTCHPDRKHKAKGLCQKCYDHQKWLQNTSNTSLPPIQNPSSTCQI